MSAKIQMLFQTKIDRLVYVQKVISISLWAVLVVNNVQEIARHVNLLKNVLLVKLNLQVLQEDQRLIANVLLKIQNF